MDRPMHVGLYCSTCIIIIVKGLLHLNIYCFGESVYTSTVLYNSDCRPTAQILVEINPSFKLRYVGWAQVGYFNFINVAAAKTYGLIKRL